MQEKHVIGKPVLVIIALVLMAIADGGTTFHFGLTEKGSNIAYASAPIETDRNSIPPLPAKENVGTNRQVTVGVVKWIQCQDRCYLTLASQESGQIITLKGSPALIPEKGRLKDHRVKVTWHPEKIFHPAARVSETEKVIDHFEMLP